ncbi:hypothetical protein EQG41_11610 [Billgrantia azerbaijanica]|nr:hypothetical protein EQG41_11610 [Halomonas azerbaijanica]
MVVPVLVAGQGGRTALPREGAERRPRSVGPRPVAVRRHLSPLAIWHRLASDGTAALPESACLEETGLIEERSHRLFSALESRTDAALEELAACRAQLRELTARLHELEAVKLELTEENRELSEQNRELEEDNGRLRERLRRGEPAPAFPGAARRAQGLSALIGHRPREEAPAEEAATREPPSKQGKQEVPVPASASAEPPAATEGGERQGSLAIEQAPSPEALLAQWYQRYPQTFFKGHTRPLKVGIHLDLAAREPWPEKLVRRALAGYVNLPRYLKGVREGAERIGLDGKPHGQVDAEAAEHAHRKLERLRAERARRGDKGHQPGRAARKRRTGSAENRDSRRQPKPGNRARPGREATGAAPSEPIPSGPQPDDMATQRSPEARMEAKLSALVAKHNHRR